MTIGPGRRPATSRPGSARLPGSDRLQPVRGVLARTDADEASSRGVISRRTGRNCTSGLRCRGDLEVDLEAFRVARLEQVVAGRQEFRIQASRKSRIVSSTAEQAGGRWPQRPESEARAPDQVDLAEDHVVDGVVVGTAHGPHAASERSGDRWASHAGTRSGRRRRFHRELPRPRLVHGSRRPVEIAREFRARWVLWSARESPTDQRALQLRSRAHRLPQVPEGHKEVRAAPRPQLQDRARPVRGRQR